MSAGWRRYDRGVEPNADGTWTVGMDHVSRAAAYETARARDRPVAIETLSTVSVEPYRQAGVRHSSREGYELEAGTRSKRADDFMTQDRTQSRRAFDALFRIL